MKKYLVLMLMLTFVGMSNAAVVMLDDFEGYADDAAAGSVGDEHRFRHYD